MNNLSYDETMLYIMYNDNVRYIQQLIDNNNVIRDNIINRSYLSRNNNRRNRQFNNRQSNNRQANDRQNNNIAPNTRLTDYYTLNYYTPYYYPNYQTPNYYMPNYYNLPNYSRNYNYNNNRDTTRYPTNIFYRRTYIPPPPLNPSRLQIENATRSVRFGDLVSPIHTVCPISHETFNNDSQVTVIRHCGHIFYTTELNTWFQHHFVCPVCRYDIRNYINDDNSRQHANIKLSNLTQQTNAPSDIDVSNNTVYTDNLANDILNIFNSVLSLDPSYNTETSALSFMLRQYTLPSSRY